MQKPFEIDVGTFKNAINPKIQNFRDFPKYFKKIEKTNLSLCFVLEVLDVKKPQFF